MSKSDSQSTDMQRRKVLAVGAVAAGAATIAPGVMLTQVAQAKPASEAASRSVRWGMLVDTNKCKTGCDDCVTACGKENGWAKDTTPDEQKPQWMRKVNLKHKATGKETSLPMMCQHCEKPPCVDVCPTGASMKRNDGIVLVDKHICIGCRYCMMACPYKARSFVHEVIEDHDSYMPRGMGTAESCTMCVHRVDNDQLPACVESCKEKAIVFGDLNDPNSDISKRLKEYPSRQIRADLRLNTGVSYEGI